MMSNINSITVGVAAKDIEGATRWYKALLGDVEMIEPAPGVVELQLTENTWLQLDGSGDLAVGGSIVRFGINDIETMHKQVKKLMPDVGEIEFVEGVIRYFDFKDPAGNRLSCYQLL